MKIIYSIAIFLCSINMPSWADSFAKQPVRTSPRTLLMQPRHNEISTAMPQQIEIPILLVNLNINDGPIENIYQVNELPEVVTVSTSAKAGDRLHFRIFVNATQEWEYLGSGGDPNRDLYNLNVNASEIYALNISVLYPIPQNFYGDTLGAYLQIAPKNDLSKIHTIKILINIEDSPKDTGNDDLILSQGYGGSSIIQVRNMDPRRGPVTQIVRSFRGASGKFAEAIGGAQRATYVSVGDVKGDATDDYVISFGPISNETPAAVPNAVVVRDGKTLESIGNSFSAFPIGNSRPVEYNFGDIHTAVGNFTGTAPLQIAAAQGIGGDGIVRIFQYTGAQAPHSYRVVNQFLGLTSNVRTNNANGGLNISAGDVNKDGLDELIVSQSYSATSKSICNVLSFNPNGEIDQRIGLMAFPSQDTSGGAGVRTTVCDINGDGINEIVVALQKRGANTISVCKPIIDNNQITGFSISNIPTKVTLPSSINPSGFLHIASGELDNGENGDELLFGTDWVYEMKNGFVQYSLPAPFSAYQVAKPYYILDQNIIIYVSPLYFFDSIQNIHAFLGDYNPTSGTVHVATGKMH